MICCEPCYRESGSLNEATFCIRGVYKCQGHTPRADAPRQSLLARLMKPKGAA